MLLFDLMSQSGKLFAHWDRVKPPKCWEPGEFVWLDSQLYQSWDFLFLNPWNAVGMWSLARSKGSQETSTGVRQMHSPTLAGWRVVERASTIHS